MKKIGCDVEHQQNNILIFDGTIETSRLQIVLWAIG